MGASSGFVWGVCVCACVHMCVWCSMWMCVGASVYAYAGVTGG